jgi:hypothetical protein
MKGVLTNSATARFVDLWYCVTVGNQLDSYYHLLTRLCFMSVSYKEQTFWFPIILLVVVVVICLLSFKSECLQAMPTAVEVNDWQKRKEIDELNIHWLPIDLEDDVCGETVKCVWYRYTLFRKFLQFVLLLLLLLELLLFICCSNFNFISLILLISPMPIKVHLFLLENWWYTQV